MMFPFATQEILIQIPAHKLRAHENLAWVTGIGELRLLQAMLDSQKGLIKKWEGDLDAVPVKVERKA